jgi:cell division septation protein DedD
MKVSCPNCQFENQSNSSQVFCSRCATMIDVRSIREQGGDSGLPGAGVGHPPGSSRPNSRLPFSAHSDSVPASNQPAKYSVNYDGGDQLNFKGSGRDGEGMESNVPLLPGRSRDAYATRVGDDFDDLLDIPPVRPVSRSETAPILESDNQVLDATPSPWVGERGFSSGRSSAGGQGGRGIVPEPSGGYGVNSGDNANGYGGEAWQSEDGGGFNSGSDPGSAGYAGRGGARETREFMEEDASPMMGWPVLTESSDEGDDEYQDENSGRQGLVMRILLGAAVFAGLIGGAYFFLGDLISKRKDQAENMQVSGQVDGREVAAVAPAAPGAEVPAATPTPGLTAPLAGGTDPLAAGGAGSLPGGGGQPQLIDIPPVTGRGGASMPSTPLPEASSRPTPTPAPSIPASGNWTIQIASFNDQGQAGARVASLKAESLPARVARVDIPGKGTWYRVQIGGFETREEGQRYGNQLRSRGAIQDFIVTSTGR